jgi:hypothetical protein
MLLLVGARVIEKYSTNLGTQIKISTVKEVKVNMAVLLLYTNLLILKSSYL